ncbi:MAG: hypothetical protein SWI22_11895 [Pseudomonadota bacterium]|nr:hypothetical protein [Pseudomonadota bacterium]
MSRARLIGWSAFGVCLLGYGGTVLATVLYRTGHLELREALLWGGPAALVGEVGLWVAAASLGWTIFKRRKALIDRLFGRKPREV